MATRCMPYTFDAIHLPYVVHQLILNVLAKRHDLADPLRVERSSSGLEPDVLTNVHHGPVSGSSRIRTYEGRATRFTV